MKADGGGGGQQKPLLWKAPDFNGDEVKMDEFREKDNHTWDKELGEQREEFRKQERLEKWI